MANCRCHRQLLKAPMNQLTERPLTSGAVGMLLVFLFLYLLRQTSQKVVLYNNSPGDTAQPYLKILPRRHITGNSAESLIPRILHQTWKSPEISVVFEPWVKSCIEQNPDWEYWFWTDKEMRDMIAEKYPGYLSVYDSYPENIYRADAFRIFVVHQYGGVYADLDIECLQPFQQGIGQHSCFFSTEPEVHAQFVTKVQGPLVSNAVFGCVPNHPFFNFIIQNLIFYTGDSTWRDVLHATGPILLTNLHNEFFGAEYRPTPGYRYVVPLAEPEIFQPTMDVLQLPYLKRVCRVESQAKSNERGKRVCEEILKKEFRNQATRRSVTNHHWAHTYAGPRLDRWRILENKKVFNISQLNVTKRI